MIIRWETNLPKDDDVIISWEVYRYRQYIGSDKNDEWLFKGKNSVTESERRECLVENLSGCCMYR